MYINLSEIMGNLLQQHYEYLNKKDENGIIYDTIDYPLMYCFYLGKATGEISEFYMIE